MNLHPLIVHFPIVLLTLYVGMEILMQFAYKQHPTAIFIKKGSLWIGTLTIIFSFGSGEDAEILLGKSPIIHLHEEFAEICRNIFILCSLIYLLEIPTTPITRKFLSPAWLNKLPKISQKLQKWRITVLLALLGFIVLSAVGSVGGSITRGTEHDPLAAFILEYFEG